MKAMNSPLAFSMALFRANGILCRGSTQYVIGILDVAANSRTTPFADC